MPLKKKVPAGHVKRRRPFVLPAVSDKLVFILAWLAGRKSHGKAVDKMKPLLQEEVEAGRCAKWFPVGGRYMLNFTIKFATGAARVQIGALQPLRQKGGIRVELNPAKMTRDDVRQFRDVMSRIVGDNFNALLRQPLINRIDLAVDVHGVRLSQLLVNYRHGKRGTVIAKRRGSKSRHEGYNFGSESSAYMQVVYDKGVSNLHDLLKRVVRGGIGDDSLKLNVVKQVRVLKNAPPIVRIEVRGKQMRGKTLAEVAALPNRFARFEFCDVSALRVLPPLPRKAFIAMCRTDGVAATFEAFKGSKKIRRLKKVWRTGAPDWWKPDQHWTQALDALMELRLFPRSAFPPPTNIEPS